ncbi:MAG: hypothetical protein RLZZ221_1941, partial [Verrucomicrobiota bacterium]
SALCSASQRVWCRPCLAVPLAASLFDYDLPPERVAQTPAARRDASRLLVVDRRSRRLEHRAFSDLPAYLAPGDILFRNNAKSDNKNELLIFISPRIVKSNLSLR